MAAACLLNCESLLQRDQLFSLRSKSRMIHNVSLRGVVKNTTFPVLRAVTANRKYRFTVMCMSDYYSYDVHLSRAAHGRKSTCEEISEDDDVLGPILNFEEVMKEAEARGVSLPLDLFEAAKSTGIPELCLQRYLYLQGLGCGLGFAMRSCSIFRNQMMIDPWYPIRLVIKFAFDVFGDVTTANAMIRGGTPEEISACLLGRLYTRILLNGLIAPLRLNYRSIVRLQEYISQGFRRLFRDANGSLPPYNRKFEVEADKSELFTRAAYCFATAIFSVSMIISSELRGFRPV